MSQATLDPAPVPQASARRVHLPGAPSMWFFVLGDLLIFSVYFVSYMYFRMQDPELFLQSQHHLSQDIGVINTILLLTSSLFVALGATAARDARREAAFRFIVLGLICGGLFPVLKAFEWIPEIRAGHTPGESLFFMYYYVVAGMHLCHVVLGLVILAFVAHNLHQAREANVGFVETGATYWHMVDVLWLIVFALFYLMR